MLNDKFSDTPGNKPRSPVGEELAILYPSSIVVLDQSAGNPLLDGLEELTPPAKTVLLDDPFFNGDLGLAPMLLELLHAHPGHQALLEQSIDIGRQQVSDIHTPPAICAWLYSYQPLAALQQAMRLRLDATYPEGERILLRYFDPRVLPRLCQLLSAPRPASAEEQCSFQQLLGLAQVWCHFDRNGQWVRHDNPQPEVDQPNWYLRFDAPTAAAIDRIEAINLTARALAQRGLACQQGDDAIIDAHLIVAHSLGLSDVDDQAAYAWRALRYGTPFTSHVRLGNLIKLALEQGLPLEVVLAVYLTEQNFEHGAPRSHQYF